MPDGRKNNGGHKTAGRKPKADEIKLIERLDKHIDQDEVFQVLKKKVLDGDKAAMQLYFNYRFGKPKETVDLNAIGNVSFKLKDLVQFDKTE